MKATIQLSITHAQFMIQEHGGFDPQTLSAILLSLPPGTKILGFRGLPVTTTARDFEIDVTHPSFDLGGPIVPNFERKAIALEDRIDQFAVFVGLDMSQAGSVYKKVA